MLLLRWGEKICPIYSVTEYLTINHGKHSDQGIRCSENKLKRKADRQGSSFHTFRLPPSIFQAERTAYYAAIVAKLSPILVESRLTRIGPL